MANLRVVIPEIQELSGMGAAFAAGISAGIYDEEKIFKGIKHSEYKPSMTDDKRERLYSGWKDAIKQTIG